MYYICDVSVSLISRNGVGLRVHLLKADFKNVF